MIFGNGLGMALDHRHFSLTNAMADVWNSPTALSATQKALISRCLGGNESVPQFEAQLDPLYQVTSACRMLAHLNMSQGMNVHWLSPEGREFPLAVGNYIHKVATRLHQFDRSLPRTFVTPLINFVRSSKSHIATLNYDKLLYEAFLDSDLMLPNYRDTILVDGMLPRGFSKAALARHSNNDFGYYLHLHGSPLFFDDENGQILKRPRHDLNMLTTQDSNHIVLTHVNHKISVIAASLALSTYWEYLSRCLNESTHIIVFGYSGDDTHLNELISIHAQSKPILVIEWNGTNYTQAHRHTYWREKLKARTLSLMHMENILDFTQWDLHA